MTPETGLVIGDRDWLLPAGGLLLVAIVLLWWAYHSLQISKSRRVAAAVLKFTGFAILAACLVNPLWSSTRARPGANLFAILADSSQSMQIKDVDSSESRGEVVQQVLEGEQAPWHVRLSQDFEVRRYLFDSRLQATETLASLTFDGQRSNLLSALETLSERLRGRPLGGVLLFTDGNVTDSSKQAIEALGESAVLRDLPPVYPVITASRNPRKDIAIERVAMTQTAFEDAPITIQADVNARGYRNSQIAVELLDEDGKSVARQVQTADGPQARMTFRISHRPPTAGLKFYRLQAAAQEDVDSGRIDQDTDEATFANNSYPLAIEHNSTRLRILYVAGRPNWEFKFLKRALEDDHQIDLVGLIRIANREPKFTFLGRTGESTNPLYRGFKKDSDAETERYDEPVLVRLNTRDEAELRGGFPDSAEALFEYHAIILDDVEAEFFSHSQLALINRFVAARGGGLLMLGGQESLQAGDYERTPLAEVLPVYLDASSPPKLDDKYRLALTRDGWLQSWARLRDNEPDERERLKAMPHFSTVNRLHNLKPGAMVIAHVTDNSGTTLPALAIQRFGEGRSAALTIGDLWRWQLGRRDETNDDHGKWCRQLLRWLVSDTPERIDVAVSQEETLSVPSVKLLVHVRDPEFQPAEETSVSVAIQPPEGDSVELTAEPSLSSPGEYEVLFVPRQPGAFRATVTVKDDDGKILGTRETGWVNSPAKDEFRDSAINLALLESLAERTGGRVLRVNELDEFSKGLSQLDVPISDEWTYPLWHNGWAFMALAVCLVGEWGLRRWRGLP